MPALPNYRDFTDPKNVPLGVPIEVVPGILWIRLALPFQLNHVNIYLIEDGAGWAVVDTGLGDDATKTVWESLLAGPIDRPLTRLIVTHYHPDHIGMAGWLAERFNLPVWMSPTEYDLSDAIHRDPGALNADQYRSFYRRHGLDPEAAERVLTRGNAYLKMVTGLPPAFERLASGDRLDVGRRQFDVITGGGHSPEQVMLYGAAEKLFFSADQVLSRISPNVSVSADEPDSNPLNDYVRSLASLAETIPDDALVLPGHGLPFRNGPARMRELMAHHEARCEQIRVACAAQPQSAAELVPILFTRPLDPQQTSFAFSEILAHINYMLDRRELEQADDTSCIIRYRSKTTS